MESTNLLIFDKGKLSLGQTLFRSVKSTYMHEVPFGLPTITTLVTHSGQLHSLTNLTASNSCTSSSTTSFLSTPRLHFFYFIDLWLGSIFSRWVTTDGSIMGISSTVKAKTSLYPRRRVMSPSRVCWDSSSPTFTNLSGWLGSNNTSSLSLTDCG